MFSDILEFVGYKLKQIVRSRLFPLSLMFMLMFAILVSHLFHLQIIEGEDAQAQYTQTTKKVLSLPSTRGNIYDSEGELIAYNKLVYEVTVTDNGDYANGYQKNLMLLELIRILKKHNESFNSEIPIIIDSKGNFKYTLEDKALLRFLRDMYGLKSIDDFTDAKPADITAEEAFYYLKERYGIGRYSKKEGDTYEISDKDALLCMNIRYAMSLNSYQKYVSTEVSTEISTQTVQDILEHSTELLGVEVVEDYIREYVYPVEYSHIIGYTGKASTDDLLELNEAGGNYQSGDVIGKAGIEGSCENILQGSKGERVMYVDSEGHITSIESETEAVTGADIYLSINTKLQVGIYHIIEQQLAGILLDKLEEGDVTILPSMKSSERKISVKDAYYQMINNNVLDMNHFSADDAQDAEKQIYAAFDAERSSVLAILEQQLTTTNPQPYKDLEDDMKNYMTFIYNALKNDGVLMTSVIDTNDHMYQTYRTDEEVSLQEFLRYAMTNSWIDTTKLDLSEKYTSEEQTYQALVAKVMELLTEDVSFNKEIYNQMIHNDKISGCLICLALFEQGILENDPEAIANLQNGTTSTAYQFMRAKIRTLEITPAQLALDPCSGAVTIIDSDSGAVLAMVSYPGYDINQISDSSYYYQLSQDQSHPLYSAATQTRTAPGSAFKPCTSIAGLEEGVISFDTYFDCDGIFEKQGLQLKCTGIHGPLSVVNAIAHSCNVFFSEVGYHLGLTDGEYSDQTSLEKIQKYAYMLGLGDKTGVEVPEMEPKVTDSLPIPASIGQGTHSYANVQLARYANSLANDGDVYELSLIDHAVDITGKTIGDYGPRLVSTSDVADSTWDGVHSGMYYVTHSEHKDEFENRLMISGKTGTAEENKMRPNHATFVGYAPYDDPQYSFAATIPYGYSSTYSCRLTNSVMELVEGYTTLEDVLSRGAKTDSGVLSDE